MSRSTAHEIILSVHENSAAENAPPPCPPSRMDPAPAQSPFQLLPSSTHAGVSGDSTKHALQERSVCEETIDAIWEEVGSQNSDNNSSSQECSSSSNQPGRSLQRLETARHAEVDVALAELRRHNSEPRHRSLDLDIHIDEPKIVLLQDRLLVHKPLCDRMNESPHGLEVRWTSSNSQRLVRVDSSASSKANPLSPRCFPLCPKLDNNEEGNTGGRTRASEIASLSFKNREKLEDEQIADGQANAQPVRKLEMEGGRSVATVAMGSPRGGERNSMLAMSLSKELVKTEAKSSPPLPTPSITVPSTTGVASGRLVEDEKDASPVSPVRPSVRRMEAEGEEEDPFKGIDMDDNFRQGNFTAITFAQWVTLFVVMACLICSVTVNMVKGRQLWGLELWKWFLLVLVVLCGRLVSGWLIRILVIIFEMNFLLRKKVLYFVYGLRKGVQNCLWLGLVLLAWKLMFDPHVKRTTASDKVLLLVTRLLECFLIAALLWLVKILLVKSLASSFHVTTFFDRIQESLFNQHVLETLSGPPLLDLAFEPPPLHGKVATAGSRKDQQTNANISIKDLKKMSTHNVSAGLMKRLMHLVRHPGLGTLVTTIDESAGVDQDSDDIEINSELQAKAAAMRIFKNVSQRDSMRIEREDLHRFFTTDEVSKVLCLFEGGKETGKITKKALKNWVVNVYHERRALAHSLNDTKTAVKELHRMASIVVTIIIVVVWLLILGIATTKVLVFFSSQLLLLGFIFSNTLKQVFEAIIFLFVMHPFDVGDRCIIDGIQMVVEEMKILSTVFLKADNEKVFYPNSVLATKPISNLHRSPNMKDFLNFSVHISTPTEKITALQEKISAYVEGKSEQWHPKVGLVVKELEDLNSMELSITMQHTINFQNFGERMNRRSDLLLELKRIFVELDIEYRLLMQPVLLTYPLLPPTTQLISPQPIYSAHFNS